MMRIDEFWKICGERIIEFLPEDERNDYTIELKEISKNNDTKLKGIVFIKEDIEFSPIFYVNTAYEQYQNGKSIESILMDLADAVEESWNESPTFDVYNFEYENIKNKVTYQLVDGALNEELLNKCIHQKLDNGMALLYYITYNTSENGVYRSAITNDLANSYNYDIDQLQNDAEINTKNIYPAYLVALQDMIEGMMFNSMMEDMIPGLTLDSMPENLLNSKQFISSLKPYVLSNNSKMFGASSIMYEGMQEKIYELLNEEYYVLPSSIHELIILPSSCDDTLDLIKMVRSANEMEVDPNEILSNRVFYFNKNKGTLIDIEDKSEQPRFNYDKSVRQNKTNTYDVTGIQYKNDIKM